MINRTASILLSCLLTNSPIVFPLDLRYDEGQNAVVLEWEYLGIEPATRYQIWRR